MSKDADEDNDDLDLNRLLENSRKPAATSPDDTARLNFETPIGAVDFLIKGASARGMQHVFVFAVFLVCAVGMMMGSAWVLGVAYGVKGWLASAVSLIPGFGLIALGMSKSKLLHRGAGSIDAQPRLKRRPWILKRTSPKG